ncbi:MAG: hypothetical protein ACREFJ_09620 [Acetobacteraceae bacterium]
MSGSESKSDALHRAHADAYRAYLRSLKESLAKVDIEAIDLSRPQAGKPPSLFTFFTIQTFYTWYTYHTYGCVNCVSCEACIAE